jgi:hypothetical protein
MQAASSAKQAALAQSTAKYNASVDIANAQQVQLNAAANIRAQRNEDQAFRSKIRVAYAASGILSGTGSPMEVLATTAGRHEQDIANYWNATNEKSDKYYGAAKEGIAEGDAQSDLYHLQGAAAVVKGIGSLASMYGGGASTGSELGGKTDFSGDYQLQAGAGSGMQGYS